ILLPAEVRNFCRGIQSGSPEIYLIQARRKAPTSLRIARWDSCGFPPGYCDSLWAGRQAGKFGLMVRAIRTRTDKSNGRRSLARGLMALFRFGQETPAQGLILHVVLAQGQGGHRLGHLVSEIESMARIDRLFLRHLREQIERISTLEVHLVVHDMKQAALGEQAKIAV